MIIGKIHPGSGVGDQLFCYLAARIRAKQLNVPFGYVGKEYCKFGFIKDIDWGEDPKLRYSIEYPAGKTVIEDKHELYELLYEHYDPEFNFIPDNSVIDGFKLQDEKYWKDYLPEIREWLKTDKLEVPDNLCVINFRGGEFSAIPDLFLPKSYWYEAMTRIELICPKVTFEVHTDDVNLASQFFHVPIIHDVEVNWKSIRYAPYLILANSAFGIIPSHLNENAKTIIAPRFWARRNLGYWSLPQNYYKKFTYI